MGDVEMSQTQQPEAPEAMDGFSRRTFIKGVIAAGAVSDRPGLALSGAALAAQLAIGLPNGRPAECDAEQIGIQHAAKAG